MSSEETLPLYTTGTLSKRFQFRNIKTLLQNYNEKIYSEPFYLDFTSWQLFIAKIIDEEQEEGPYLSIHLEKDDNDYENQFSYDVKKSFTILSVDASKNVIQTDFTSSSRYVYGKRNGEGMAWGYPQAILWGNLLNPQIGYIFSNDDTIEIELNMELVSVMGHKTYCQCPACV